MSQKYRSAQTRRKQYEIDKKIGLIADHILGVRSFHESTFNGASSVTLEIHTLKKALRAAFDAGQEYR